MRVYTEKSPLYFCGHWNGSPVEIGEAYLTDIPASEVRHSHPYHEYYVVLEGGAELEVEGEQVHLQAGMVVMVAPHERHEVTSVSPGGVRWVIVKERSEPGSKIAHQDAQPES